MNMKKGLLLYVCYRGYSGAKYYVPTDEELKKVLAATDEILLIPITTYNKYDDADGNEYQVVDMQMIDDMTVDMVGSPDRFETIKSEYRATAEARIAANYHIKDYINDASDYARRLVALKPDVKLWFSVPAAECLHALTHFFTQPWADTVDRIKDTVGDDIWNNNVQGIYYSGEDVVTAGYTKFDETCPENDFNNPIVVSMRGVSDRVHSYGKEMLWIPYYHAAASSSTNLGYVANLTDIFDTVIIQPSLFFAEDRARTGEINIVRDCVLKQAVVDPDGNIIGGKKTSKTRIGFEMEIDSQFFDLPGYPERYYKYEETFGDLVGTYPTAFYAGCPDTMVQLTDLIGKFLNKND